MARHHTRPPPERQAMMPPRLPSAQFRSVIDPSSNREPGCQRRATATVSGDRSMPNAVARKTEGAPSRGRPAAEISDWPGVGGPRSSLVAAGGLKYASRADRATRREQIAVARHLAAIQGMSAWGCA
ncbi:transglycosylase family protein [Streptomyces collinus]